MVNVSLDLTKTLEQNAAVYFERAKKIKKKIAGVGKILGEVNKRLVELEQKQIKFEEKRTKGKKIERKIEWYEKFRWFYSSDGFLCIGGRDATSNEIVIKKYLEKGDLVFHTEIPGSPFFVVKSQGKQIPEATILEAAQATASYSKAWKLGVSVVDVYYVAPEQVSKEAKAGEYMPKGAFVIYGKRSYVSCEVKLAVGIIEDRLIMSGPLSAVSKNCGKYVVIVPGDKKPSDIAKQIRHIVGGELDEIMRTLPAGESKIVTG